MTRTAELASDEVEAADEDAAELAADDPDEAAADALDADEPCEHAQHKTSAHARATMNPICFLMFVSHPFNRAPPKPTRAAHCLCKSAQRRRPQSRMRNAFLRPVPVRFRA